MSTGQPKTDETLQVAGARVVLVASRYNAEVVDRLIGAARATLERYGVGAEQIETIRVPGAWELPLAAAHVADRGEVDAIVALGAVIRGGTPHFEYVCHGCATGLMQVQQEFGIPVAFGVLTCDDDEQARARAGDGTSNNKGAEAALAALEMIRLLRRIDV